ncbi:predicted protein [Uncinocarpus reesii 1704]|uniref:Uncharacterized protein n=1 Tax=Uncinocarpus reesii (strain UAMH 1704) TaxID=336963 RepID=C4JDV4_UNCRE|nr:uncharacterized protein UREG_00581 [Uncinocarpus reesii 1704]EEP75734.1 predicted protein [Uncinocarpus reesii 1704]
MDSSSTMISRSTMVLPENYCRITAQNCIPTKVAMISVRFDRNAFQNGYRAPITFPSRWTFNTWKYGLSPDFSTPCSLHIDYGDIANSFIPSSIDTLGSTPEHSPPAVH